MPAGKSRDNDTLLVEACRILGLVDGCLLPASAAPSEKSVEQWTDKGDWLTLANEVCARDVFFVDNEPVLVLAELPDGDDEGEFFNRIWSMARPQILFLAREGELAVYQLGAAPVKGDEPVNSGNRLLALASNVSEIATKLARFRRESIESGQVYGDPRFGNGAERADRALVHDLKRVCNSLTEGESGLDPSIAHALIGRALFVRYLEDRDILVPDYFAAVARTRPEWHALLDRKPREFFAEPRFAAVLFFRVLQDKDFTYELFRKLARDFNGDTFPVTDKEWNDVQPHHLGLLRELLMGDDVVEKGQRRLFLFAYRFDIIPIELISSIYENFYAAQRGKGKTQSSYYTPPALVDFLLSRALTTEVLDKRPRIIDPACGSGIFLVETFRRMVRHRVAKQRKRLSQRELRVILRDQLRGVDLNPEAVPVAAFSLYLAYLHYQKPREIDESRRLPNLRWDPKRKNRDPEQHFDILFSGNAFDAIAHGDPVVHQHFGPGSADVVVGNPPWGKVNLEDTLGRRALAQTMAWCEAKLERIIGDKELSQAFVQLALELLVDGGIAALLLSSGVLFKQQDNSRRFRESWLRRCKLAHIVNFAHVRHLHFSDPGQNRRGDSKVRESDGTSPFISAIFEKGEPPPEHRFSYWSARRIAEVERTRAVVISRADMHHLNQDECRRYENVWKIYWWGGRRDEGLIREMERFPGLDELPVQMDGIRVLSGQGFMESNKHYEAEWLAEYKEFPAKCFQRYGAFAESNLVPVPDTVKRRGIRELYEGTRLLLNRGVGVDGIVARLETATFCFRNSIQGFRLEGFQPWQESVLLAIFWSSLAKYYFWLTAGSWGMWHDELLLHVVERFPIAFPTDKKLRDRIVRHVDKLRETELLFGDPRLTAMEKDLDEAIFDLYELNAADRDLVRDMCNVGLDFFYKRSESAAVSRAQLPTVRHGLACDLPEKPADAVAGYLQVFLSQWNADLEPDGELAWEIVPGPGNAPVLAALFSTVANGQRVEPSGTDNRIGTWNHLLQRISAANLVSVDAQRTIYTDTFVRVVSDHEIIIIKRNEARFWTRSAALADADATVAQAMTIAERGA